MNKASGLMLAVLVSCGTQAAFALDLGRSWVEPDTAMIRQEGTWDVHYVAGLAGIGLGGGLRVQFPNAWIADPWGKRKEPQIERPDEANYVSVHTEYGEGEGPRLEVSIGREGVDRQHDRFYRIFNVIVHDKPLLPGDHVVVRFAKTLAPQTAEKDSIKVGLDPGGNELFIPLKSFPQVTVHPGPAQKLLVLLPSQVVTGESIEARIVALDEWNNRATSYRGTIEITVNSQNPRSHAFTDGEQGLHLHSLVLSDPGIYTLEVKDSELPEGPVFVSNPVRMTEKEPKFKRYWGDLHSHSSTSKDGIGRPQTAFQNAREVFGLNFYALTDHSVGDLKALGEWWEGILPEEWALTQELVRSYYEPGEFVSFLGYEWSSPAPYGDHNIYFKDTESYFFDLEHHRTIQSLWKQLEAKEAFTVPHHTAIMWRGINSPYVDWSDRNDAQRPAVEIYSLHGASEFFNHPMGYEHFDFTPATSNPGPYYARDGWAAGHWLAAIAGSDNHTCHPGQPFGGLTCVLAPELTREAVFDAILARRTYATTGSRILLDFRINGRLMGERIEVPEGQPIKATVNVVATGALDFVEISRCAGGQWKTVSRWHPQHNANSAELEWSETGDFKEALYYCRLKQSEPFFGRDVMAWSSPIWVTQKPE